MSQEQRLKVLLIAPYYDKNTPGESWCTYKWVEQISERCDVTVLTSHRAGWDAGRSPIKAVEVVNWTHPVLTFPCQKPRASFCDRPPCGKS